MEEEIKRLEGVLLKIKSFEGHQEHFDELYALLQDEYNLNGGLDGNGVYNNNLRQTIQKQAESYIASRKLHPKKGAPIEFQDFIDNFRTDVKNELTKLRR